MGLTINMALSCSHGRKYSWNTRIWKYLWYIISSFHFLYLEFIFIHPPSLFCQCCVGYLSSHLALEMTLVHQNLAIVNRTKHPKKGALEMILVHENLAIVNRTKHPNKVEKKVQQWRTQVLAKSEHLFRKLATYASNIYIFLCFHLKICRFQIMCHWGRVPLGAGATGGGGAPLGGIKWKMKKWKKQLFPLTCQFDKRTLLFPFFHFLLDEISSSVHQREFKTDVKFITNFLSFFLSWQTDLSTENLLGGKRHMILHQICQLKAYWVENGTWFFKIFIAFETIKQSERTDQGDPERELIYQGEQMCVSATSSSSPQATTFSSSSSPTLKLSLSLLSWLALLLIRCLIQHHVTTEPSFHFRKVEVVSSCTNESWRSIELLWCRYRGELL